MNFAMRNWIVILLIGWLIGATTAPVEAVIIYLKGKEEPVKGHLVRQSPSAVIVSQLQPDGTFAEKNVPRSAIEEMIVTVSEERLGELSHERPKDYRDYAEELAEKREDPDARITAIRLYLIAALLDPEGLGRSSLLGAASLARNEDEDRKFRAAVYLLDPEHDPRLLKTTGKTFAEPGESTEAQRTALEKTLRALRGGTSSYARRMLQRPNVKEQLKIVAHAVSYDELFKACEQTGPISNKMFRLIVKAELALAKMGTTAEPTESDDAGRLRSWSKTMAAGATAPLPSLAIETLVPTVDPRKCHYRDGKWVEP